MTVPRTFETLVAKYPPAVQVLAHHARDFVLDIMGADAQESIDTSGPYAFYGYAPGYKGLVCSLIVSKSGVKLGIAHGAELDDPQRLLEGAGKVHKHIPLEAPADLRKPGVKALLKAAIKSWRSRSALIQPTRPTSPTRPTRPTRPARPTRRN